MEKPPKPQQPQIIKSTRKRDIIIVILIILMLLLIGIIGFRYLGKLSWIDSFFNSAVIVGGTNPSIPIQTNVGKIFTSFYSLIVGALFIAVLVFLIDRIIVEK